MATEASVQALPRRAQWHENKPSKGCARARHTPRGFLAGRRPGEGRSPRPATPPPASMGMAQGRRTALPTQPRVLQEEGPGRGQPLQGDPRARPRRQSLLRSCPCRRHQDGGPGCSNSVPWPRVPEAGRRVSRARKGRTRRGQLGGPPLPVSLPRTPVPNAQSQGPSQGAQPLQGHAQLCPRPAVSL